MAKECSRRQFIDWSCKLAAVAGLAYFLDSPPLENNETLASQPVLPLGELELDPGNRAVRFASAVELAHETQRHYCGLPPIPKIDWMSAEQVSLWSDYWGHFFRQKGWQIPERLSFKLLYNQSSISGTSHRCQMPVTLRFPGGPRDRSTVELLPGLMAHELAHLWQDSLCATAEGSAIETAAEVVSWVAQAEAIGADPASDRARWLQRSLWKTLSIRTRDLVGLSWIREKLPNEVLTDWANQTQSVDQQWLSQYLSFGNRLNSLLEESVGQETASHTRRWYYDQLLQSAPAIYAEGPWYKVIDSWQKKSPLVKMPVPAAAIDLSGLFKLFG